MPSAAHAICDAGPLIALFDPQDFSHARCRRMFQAFSGRLVATWPVLAELFHFLDHSQQNRFWDYAASRGFLFADVLPGDLLRLRGLMDKYADLPMDLADGSLVVVAERLGISTVFSLDRHFLVYRPRHVSAFELLV